MHDEMIDYVEKLVSPKADWIRELESTAEQNRIPIMERISIDFMLKHIQVHQPKRMLEIGTAIGYSALRMIEASPESKIITIEKDEERYHEAVENIQKYRKENKIEVILGDALEVIPELERRGKMFDLVFMDAAKGKYQAFFDLVHPLLDKSGWLITDNVLFRGYVNLPKAPKRYKSMVKKLNAFNEYLLSHPDYISTILPIGDGVMLSYKK